MEPAPAVTVTTDVDAVVDRLCAGGLAVLPTETVYGLAADAEQPSAVARIFSVKGRPPTHPLIVHLGDPAVMHDGWIDPSISGDLARAIDLLAATCWPGPLTMLVRRGPRALDDVTGGRDTVGIRVPAHADAQTILSRFDERVPGGGLAAPSANRFGRVSPTTAQHVLADLGTSLDPQRDVVFDGGRSGIGVESTIVDLSVWPPQVLRAGAVGADDISTILDVALEDAHGPSRSSGMLVSHYAPRCPVVLADDRQHAEQLAAAWTSSDGVVRVLDRTDDIVRAAFELYSDLRAADADGLGALVVVLPPARGIGHAVRDRLFKASAGSGPRSSRDD